jgi:hypothetical protein
MSAVSADRSALADVLLDGDAELLGDDAELCGVVLELELGLLDDEHAASSIAAPTAVSPKATRDARGLRRLVCANRRVLPSLKLLMRPRISHPGSDKTVTPMIRMHAAGASCQGIPTHTWIRPPARLLKDLTPVHKIVNIPVNMIASHSGHYRAAKT